MLLYIVHTNTGFTGYCTLYVHIQCYCALNNCNNCIITYNWTYYYTVTYKPWTYYYTVTYKPWTYYCTVTYKPWTYYCTVTYETCLYITRQDNSPYLGYFTPNLPNVFSMGVLGFCGSKYLEVYISYMVYELQLFLESSGGEEGGEDLGRVVFGLFKAINVNAFIHIFHELNTWVFTVKTELEGIESLMNLSLNLCNTIS